ncbi:MAG: S8 family serine peptidase [Bacteroidales bacterium]|nr:S8 family serine peptidase [Bacteroidales bacterium]
MSLKKWLLVSGVFLALAACQKEAELLAPSPEESPAAEQAVGASSVYVPGQMNVYFDDDLIAMIEEDLLSGKVKTKAPALNTLLAEYGVVSMRRLFPEDPDFEDRHREFGLHKWYRVTFDQAMPETKAVADFASLPGVVNATPVLNTTNGAVFNDPMLSRQWGYENGSTAWADVNVVPVWQGYSTGIPDVIVSVVDDGIDLSHEDLADNVLAGGANGSKNFMLANTGYRIVAGDHGTHVAGTIAAVNNNGKGVCGIAGGDAAKGQKGVKLMSCQIFQDGLSGSDDAAALVWGADHGAVVSNNSWGYKFYDKNSNYDTQAAKATHDFYSLPNTGAGKDGLKDAIDYFNQYAGTDKKGHQTGPMMGGVVFFAAGNDGRQYGPPANYPGCMAVGAVTPYGTRSNFSNYGDWVDICAPGVDILSTTPKNTYSFMDGTSMACPHVTGVAALIVSACGGDGFTREQLWDKLIEGANNADVPASYRIGPLVDAFGALFYGNGEPPAQVSETEVQDVVSNNVTIEVEVPADKDGKPAYGFRVLAATTKEALDACDPAHPSSGILHGSFLSHEAGVGEKISGTVGDLGFETTYHIGVSAFDYGRNFSPITYVGQITTKANHAPEITTAYSGNFKFNVLDRFVIPFSISDPDNHVLNVQFDKDQEDPGVLSLLESTNPGVYNIQVIGNAMKEGEVYAPGKYHAVLQASDNYGKKVEYEIDYETLPNGAPAILKSFDNVILRGSGDVLQIDTKDYIADPEGEILQYTIDISDRSVVQVNQATSSTVITLTGLSESGSATVTLMAEDAGKLPVEASFQVLVRKGDEPLQCYPNPVVTTLYVATGEEPADTQISIISSTGAVVYRNAATFSAFNPAVIDVKKAAPGFYTIQVTYGGNTYTSSFIKK